MKDSKTIHPLKLRIRNRGSKSGFTYIEMLVVIALMALCFVPLLRMFTASVEEIQVYSDLGTALQLGREAMELVKNLRFTEEQIRKQGTVWIPREKDPPRVLNGKAWKVRRSSVGKTDPLEVYVQVFREPDLDHPLLELVTLMEDL